MILIQPYVSNFLGLFYSQRSGCSNSVYCRAKDFFINATTGSDAARGLVNSFLDQVAIVPAYPFPFHFVARCRFIQAGPPLVVSLAAKASAHCFNDVTRVGKELDTTWFRQRFKAQRRRGYFRLLVGCMTQVLTDRAPDTLESKQSHRCCARGNLPVAETGAVAKNGY